MFNVIDRQRFFHNLGIFALGFFLLGAGQPLLAAPATAETDDTIEAGEFIVYSDDIDAARELDNKLRELGYDVKRRRVLKQLGLVLSVIRIPKHKAVANAMQMLHEVDARLVMDANHRYQLAGNNTKPVPTPQQMIKWATQSSQCGKQIRLGLIDTAIDTRHPALANTKILTKSFLPADMQSANKRHATAVASILIGSSPVSENLRGLLPGAKLYNAAIFRRRADDQVDTTAEMVISALDWLLSHRVQATNISLAGNANRLLEIAVERSLNKNQVLVAAAGNNGPSAPPAYPAAWSGVVTVTAVDASEQVYPDANQGSYIDFAAPGVDVWAARAGGTWSSHSGTSYAAPYVTAAFALLRQQNPDEPPAALLSQLQQQVRDLGEPGKDPVFGHGLLQISTGCNGSGSQH